MATYWSEHFAAESDSSTTPATSIADPRIKSDPGKKHATTKRSFAHLDFTGLSSTLADEDNIVCFPMKSGDRLWELYFTGTAAWDYTTLTLHLGLYKLEDDYTITAIDDDLFNSALDGTATTARTDQFTSGALTDEERGRPLWYLADEGGGTYTEDPHETWLVVIHIDALSTYVANGIWQVEAVYTPQSA